MDESGSYRANGSLDPGEPSFAGVRLSLGAGACPSFGLAETATTANAVSYSFTGLSAGTYCVSIDAIQESNASILPLGFWTYPTVVTYGPVNATVTLKAGEQKTNVDFGVSLPNEVKPGSAVDVSAALTAPTTPGTYTSLWKLLIAHTPATTGVGPYLGVGPDGAAPLYTRIVVGKPSTPATTRIAFDAGATSARIDGNLKAGEIKDFILYALKGQTLMVTLTSLNNDVSVLIRARGQAIPLAASTPATGAVRIDQLPASQDYLIEVLGNTNTSFSLNVAVPHHITFAQGGTSATVTGKTSARRSVAYLLRASAGQTLTAILTSPDNGVGLTIYGLQDGQPLVRAEGQATAWTGQLPVTQDYVIQVLPRVDATHFTLQVIVK